MAELISGFKTDAGRQAYQAAYAAVLEGWAQPYQELWVPTAFGETHVVASGPPGAPPLVLLHGFGVSGAMWAPNVGPLSQSHRVYAVDCLGQPGLSSQTRPLSTRAEYVAWLGELFDALHLERAAVVGLSYGGWLAASLALEAPARVEQLALLAPAATLLPLRRRFFVMCLPMVVFPTRATTSFSFGWLAQGYRWDRVAGEPMILGMVHWKWPAANAYPAAFSDDELRALDVPALVLVGEREVIYAPRPALERARRLMPRVQAELVPDACHLLSAERAGWVNLRLQRFLAAQTVTA
jgi:pimeloyl-ACP methyl ester carboxylesterase